MFNYKGILSTTNYRICDFMAEGIEELEKINQEIKTLEDTKVEMIDRVRYLMRRIRFKKFEQKALEPYLEETRDVQIAPLRKRRNKMEFMIATAAYTPKIEREWLKEVRKLDEALEKVKEVERARRKIRFVEDDIKQGEQEVVDLENKIRDSKDKLRRLYDEAKSVRMSVRRTSSAAASSPMMEEDMVTLGDLALIERKDIRKD